MCSWQVEGVGKKWKCGINRRSRGHVIWIIFEVENFTAVFFFPVTCSIINNTDKLDHDLFYYYLFTDTFIYDTAIYSIHTMAAEQRKLLEQLMGADALDARATKFHEHINLRDPKICKSFLVGICPYNLFTGTKQDLGRCPKQHLEKHKMEYLHLKNRKGQEFPEFDLEYERDLEKYINECNRRIETANRRLEKTPEDEEKLDALTKELETLDMGIKLGLEELELLGTNNEIMKAVEQLEVIEDLKEQKRKKEADLKNLVDQVGFSGHQKLQVCVLCGAYLSRLDNDRRLADHFIGKMHLGYRRIRQAYKEIHEKNRKRKASGTHI